MAPSGVGTQLLINPATTNEVTTAQRVKVASWQREGAFDGPSFQISAHRWRVIWAAEPDVTGVDNFAKDVYKGDGVL
jgi:hypothetical protein